MSDVQHFNLANASLFNPPGRLTPSVQVFRDVLLRDLGNIRLKKTHLTKSLQSGLDQLCENKEIIIHPADEGGGIVILNKSDYLKALNHLVGDTDTYVPLPADPRPLYKKKLENVDKGFISGIINKKEKAFLVPASSRIPIYILLT